MMRYTNLRSAPTPRLYGTRRKPGSIKTQMPVVGKINIELPHASVSDTITVQLICTDPPRFAAVHADQAFVRDHPRIIHRLLLTCQYRGAGSRPAFNGAGRLL
jgi:hypothetical protein